MALPQNGIFALGNLAHAYLEFDKTDGTDERSLVRGVADLTEPRTTTGGVNLVTGFRPELWARVAADDAPRDLHGFDAPVLGPDGYAMAATQHDLVVWIAGPSYDVVFDTTIAAAQALSELALLRAEAVGWSYHHDRDLTGFIDGTENPALTEAPFKALVPQGSPGAGGSVLLLQKWEHEAQAWSELSTEQQEQAIGRRKSDSEELADRPETSHAARTDQDDFGTIFRRNTAYGIASEHGTMFVGFSAKQQYLAAMLESMVGTAGPRDELTRYTRAVSGSYYFVPSLDDLAPFTSVEP